MSSAPIPKGYILLSRKLLDNEIMAKPPLYLKVWIYLLTNAQHKDYKGLKRGQLFTSIPKIQEAMSYMVGYRKETPSYKQIRGVLDWLRFPYEGTTKDERRGSMIDITKGTHGMVVTIVKYDLYQDPKNYEGHNEGHNEGIAKDERRARQGHNINKNVKNDKNDKKVYGEFVRLTEEEHQKLLERLGQALTADYIERLNNYIGSKGKKYKSHYHTILSWVRKDEAQKPTHSNHSMEFYLPEESQ
jgi:hypothetical protein